jgi:hypothetical protein
MSSPGSSPETPQATENMVTAATNQSLKNVRRRSMTASFSRNTVTQVDGRTTLIMRRFA